MRIGFVACFSVVFAILNVSAEVPRFYVAEDAAPGGDGSSWDSAYDDLQEAIAIALDSVAAGGGASGGGTAEVWVKRGLYVLDGALSDRRGLSGLRIYGGFDGTETKLAHRQDVHLGNATVLWQGRPGARVIEVETPPDELAAFQFSQGGSVTVEWQAIAGEKYMVQYAEDPEGSWKWVSNVITADRTAMSFTIENGAPGYYRVLKRSGDPVQRNFRLDGFTLTGARDVDGHGGGLLIRHAASSVVIENCIIAENTTLGRGGGIAVLGSVTYPSAPTLADLEITNNRSKAAGSIDGGGGIYFQTMSGGHVQNSIISANRTDGPRGGGLYIEGSTTNPLVLITESRISNNSSGLAGGGVFTLAPVTIRQSVLAGNECRAVTSEAWGGGALFAHTEDAHIVIDRSVLNGNLVAGAEGRGGGGALHFRTAGIVSVTNSLISGNAVPGSVQTRGAAVYFREANQGAFLRHNTFAENFVGRTAGNDGGTINVRAGQVGVYNSIFALNNTVGIRVWHEGDVTRKGNLFYPNSGGEVPTGDPRFIGEGKNAITGTWESVGLFAGNDLTNRGAIWVTADGMSFDGMNLTGGMINPNTEQTRHALVVAQAENQLLIEGNLAEEFGVQAGAGFRVIDYRLEDGSAAIDAGDSAVSGPVDYAGTPRSHGAGPDSGAFEFPRGMLEVVAFFRKTFDELVLDFRSPFGDRDHIVEYRKDLDAGEWTEQEDTVMADFGDGTHEARIPKEDGDRGFYRLKAIPRDPRWKSIVSVRDFGAVPDDGNCDAAAINAAIQYARGNSATAVEFQPGVYNLKYQEGGASPTLILYDVSDLMLLGQADSSGEPATVLELNLPLRNNFGVRHLDARNSRNLRLENLVFDLNPRYSTSGKVIEVIPENEEVRVEILPGMPHFEGMRCYSANAWDLETRDLLPVPPLTINMEDPYFENLWHRVEDEERIVYSIRNMPFVDLVNVGDGISWHYSVQTTSGFTLAFNTIDGLELHNLRIHNSITLSMKAYDTRDITITDVRIEPVGNSLAVGPRDAIHLSNPRGELYVENLYIKGVRWDPFVSRVNFVTVVAVDGDTLECVYSVVGNPDTFFQKGDQVDFWAGDEPFKMEVSGVEVLSPRGEKRFRLKFTEDLPDFVNAGTLISPPTWDAAVIRDSVFEGNSGTAIVYENANLIIEGCLFRNNTYNAIGLGPTSLNTGAFAENVVIRDNHFSASNWVSKYGRNHGMITTFEQHPMFSNEPYNRNITIIGNVFEDIDYNEQVAAIQIRNAQNVSIDSNVFRNVSNTVVVDPDSTREIFIDNGTED